MGHLIPLLEGGLTLIALEMFLFKPSWLIFFVAGITIFIILGTLVPKKRFSEKGEFWRYLPNPLIFVWSAILLLLFFENRYFRHFFSVGTAVYVFFYFENLFYYLASGREERRADFLRMTNLVNVVTIFFLGAGLYGVRTFIQVPLWALAFAFFVFSAGLFYGTTWIIGRGLRQSAIFIFTLALISVEMFVAISFLPLGFYVGGAVLGIVYYVISRIMINFLEKGTAPWKTYLTIGLILLFLVLFTARWV